MENKERVLKIVPKYFPRTWKEVIFPEIKLAGKWLQDIGFTCGKYVTITQRGNKIVIAVLNEKKQQERAIKKRLSQK